MDDEGLKPRTPREGLLLIRSEANRGPARILEIVEEALSERYYARSDYELHDQLADRLAEAHRVLQGVSEIVTQEWPTELVNELLQALLLPPEIEAMVDLRRYKTS